MISQESETSRYLKTFMRQLGKNRLGQPFIRLVSTSLDRKTTYSQRLRLAAFSGERRSQNLEERRKKQRAKTQPKQEKHLMSFRIKQGQLGDSVYMGDFLKTRIEKKVRQRQLTYDKGGSNFHSLILDRKSIALQEILRAREGYFKLNKIGSILSTLTGNPNLGTLRIYKERLRKFYNARYLRQKITTFLDYEYIEDYDSQLGLLESLLTLKLEEIYFICFFVLDQDSDGLISNDDLFSLVTASIKSNPLLNKDIYKIFQYIAYYQSQKNGVRVNDSLSDEDFFKTENMTLQKYRMLQLKSEKERAKKVEMESDKKSWKTVQAQGSKGFLLTRRTGKHLFSVKAEQQQGESAIKQLRKKFAEIQLETSPGYNFKINFSRFKNIFVHSIPEVYYDLLYAQGGIQLPDRQYLGLNFDIDDHEFKDAQEQEVDRYGYYRDRVENMRTTFRRSRVERLSADQKFWRAGKK